MKEPFRPPISALAAQVMKNEFARLHYRLGQRERRKLTDAQVLEIRASKLSPAKLAAKYGISKEYAYMIRAKLKRKFDLQEVQPEKSVGIGG